ncbi:MAG: YceI family protein [Flavobacteriaceae bacterium]
MNRMFFLLTLGTLCFGTVHAQSVIKSADISFVFASKDVEGTIGGFQSESAVDLEQLANSQFTGSVTVESLSTGNFLRDWSLKSSKYFDEDGYPDIRFQSTKIIEQDNGILVSGDLKIKNTSREISINFQREGKKLTGTTAVYSSDFGIDIKKKREDNLVEITIILMLE